MDDDKRREIDAEARARALACDVPGWQQVVRVESGDQEIGAVARARAVACGVPDWQRVVRVEFSDQGAAFVYEDGREWLLPGLQPV